MQDFQERVALVTGAASGIGAATAKLLGARGARVAAVGRSPNELNQIVEQIRSAGGQSMAVVADVSNAADMERAVAEIVAAWEQLDVVFANAGINGVWAPLDEITPEEWDHTLANNLRGTFLTIRYSLPHLQRGGGSIVITSSVNGTRMFSNSGATAYACSKAGQVALAKMAALELAKYKIRVNVICPGAIKTSIEENTETRHLYKARAPVHYLTGDIPLTHGEPGTAEDVAELVAFLSSDAARHISGAEVFIDGAQSILQG
jgi:NAD(P)-dependent dehydrogenase (short-subunit alcohol dehydrogenase family)